MRIRHFHIDRFGVLAGQKVENLAPGLNVFLGDNEAGKSTCRDFLRAMFFGYKRGGRNDLDYGPSNSGKAGAGGGLLLEVEGQPGPLHLVRRPGKHGGDLTLYDAQGRELPASLWQGLLSGVTADLYDKVFAFDLQDLASLESMGGQQVSAALHGAAFGTGFRSPAEVLQSLEKARKELFSPSPTAKVQSINKILQRLQEIRRKIRENGSDIERHAALSREEGELLLALEEQRVAREGLERELARNGSLLGAWELWAELGRLESELELRPHPGGDFGPDSLTRLEALCAERAEKLAALEARQEELAALERQLGEERVPTDLLRLEPACRALLRERENAALALRGIPALEAETESLERELEKILLDLGGPAAGAPGAAEPVWNRSLALAFDCSPAVRERVDFLREGLTAAAGEMEQCAREKERLEQELERAALEEDRLRQARGAGAAPDVAQSSSFGPEMRLRLEEKGRALERSRQAAAECGKARLLLEREESRLKDAQAARQKDISGLARITCREEDLHEQRQELTGLRRVAEQVEAEAADTALLARQHSEQRPALFSFTPLRRDPRRAIMALVSLGLAAFLLYPAVASLLAGQDWRGLLAGNGWSTGLVGLFCLWGAVFWLFPTFSALGLYHPAPNALQAGLLDRLNRLAGHKQELWRRVERLNAWLPEQLRVRVDFPPTEVFDPELATRSEALLDALPAFYRRVENFFGAQQEQLLRLQLLRLQEGQESERALALAGQLEEARAAEQAAEAALARERALWGTALVPYSLGPDCAPDAALQIFDRAWRVAELRLALEEAGRRLSQAGSRLEAARAEWELWLGETPFPAGCRPGAVLESFAGLAKFKELHGELERRQTRLGSLRNDLKAFTRQVRGLLEGADGLEESRPEFTPFSGDAEAAVRLFDRLLAAAEAAGRRQAIQQQRQRDLRALQGRRSEAGAALAGCEEALRQLFALAGIQAGEGADLEILQGAEEFRLRFAAYREHRELRLERDRLALQLEQRAAAPAASLVWSGPEEFRRALRAADPERLAGREAELRAERERAAQKREETLTRLGEVRAGLAALVSPTGDEGNTGLRREEAALREELEGLARRWSVLTLAQAFILQAKRSFEEERQDLVVRQAGDFFRRMTMERYRGLLFDLEGKGLKASAVQADPDAGGAGTGLSLDSEEALSRGTREQLYLALRLAYVRQHNQNRESLPLAMDDILVNFDPERAARTASILAGFAARNQVLFFTCHPHMAELLASSSVATSVPCARYRVERGEIRAV